ncbi:MAG: NAD-dependent epimerase/dehydratase family protein, partial [Verrucomicrobiaceae bacterium]
MNADFWKGKRVFLTGHTGFKGSWLSLWLQAMGAEVTGFSLAPNTEPSLFEAARVAEGMTSAIGDIRDLDALSAAVKAASPEIVIHMAAQPLVRESYVNPVFNYATNVMGTVHLLEAVRHTPGVKAVVIVTSDKCYENREWHWAYREES